MELGLIVACIDWVKEDGKERSMRIDIDQRYGQVGYEVDEDVWLYSYTLKLGLFVTDISDIPTDDELLQYEEQRKIDEDRRTEKLAQVKN